MQIGKVKNIQNIIKHSQMPGFCDEHHHTASSSYNNEVSNNSKYLPLSQQQCPEYTTGLVSLRPVTTGCPTHLGYQTTIPYILEILYPQWLHRVSGAGTLGVAHIRAHPHCGPYQTSGSPEISRVDKTVPCHGQVCKPSYF